MTSQTGPELSSISGAKRRIFQTAWLCVIALSPAPLSANGSLRPIALASVSIQSLPHPPAAQQTDGNVIYQGSFDPTDWSGDLTAITIITQTPDRSTMASSWSASQQLAARSSPETSRNIVVGAQEPNPSLTAQPFNWDAIGEPLRQQLSREKPNASNDSLGPERLNYLRGDPSQENRLFRDRKGKLLGDILHSAPAYSGPPGDSINSRSYTEFKTQHKDRIPAVFIGANDGMLHAFDVRTGDELFAYIPSWLGSRLSALTQKNYSHQSYVDASPAVAEAQIGTADSADSWKTVLVCGTGAGGRGVFALDVTDPSAFSPSQVLWEFTAAHDVDLGQVLGPPQLIKLRTKNKPIEYKWFAAVASGVNNYVADDIYPASATGQPALFLLDLSKPAGTAWTLGNNYFKISLPIDFSAAATASPGLIHFSVVLDTHQETNKIYMGDLQGNVWKLDFEGLEPAAWTLAKLSGFSEPTTGAAAPLYIARDAQGRRQPITAAPMLVRGEGKSIEVTIGTGKSLEASDLSSATTDSFYVIHDPNLGKPAPTIGGRALLRQGRIDPQAGTLSVSPFVWGMPPSAADTTQRAGWYFDFPTPGERLIGKIQLIGDTLVFATLQPETAQSWLYTLRIDEGSGTYKPSKLGLMGDPLILESTRRSTETPSDSTGQRIKTTTHDVLIPSQQGSALEAPIVTRTMTGRLSWHQIHNHRKQSTP